MLTLIWKGLWIDSREVVAVEALQTGPGPAVLVTQRGVDPKRKYFHSMEDAEATADAIVDRINARNTLNR